MIRYIKDEFLQEFVISSVKDSEKLITSITCPERFKKELENVKVMSDVDFELGIDFHSELNKFIFHEGVAWIIKR